MPANDAPIASEDGRPTLQTPNPPFPFIVGRGRSGTTLLQAMFDAHPDMAIPHEAHLIVRVCRDRHRFESNGGLNIARFAEAARTTWAQRWKCDEAELRPILEEARPSTVEDGVRAIFNAYAAGRGKSRYGEKTPINALHIALLAERFPEACFIHIVRDGRNVTLSYLDAPFGVGGVGESAIQWRRAVEHARKDGSRLGDHRYREVHYEELVAEPEVTLRELCAFVELPFDTAMLRYYELSHPFIYGSHVSIHHNLQRPPIKATRDWRNQLPRRDVAVFEALAGGTLERFGYSREFRRLPIVARIRAFVAVFGLNAGRARKHVAKRWYRLKRSRFLVRAEPTWRSGASR